MTVVPASPAIANFRRVRAGSLRHWCGVHGSDSTLTITNLTGLITYRTATLGVWSVRVDGRYDCLGTQAWSPYKHSLSPHPGGPLAVSDRRQPGEMGSGRTMDLSSSGLCFSTDTPLSPGQRLDVSIDWPALLDGGVHLQLIISGVVVRTNGTVTAVQIQRHEFRRAVWDAGCRGSHASGG